MAVDMTVREQILMRLVEVIDPETGIDVLRMRLVEDLTVDEHTGVAAYTFRPSSPLCPIAHSLAMDIKRAVASVAAVKGQAITVEGYVKAAELTEIINREDV
ncbi:MAG TPA: iron-sulfur cluster assembly protein [Anaerolineae bacterium]|nr:iron-sulfur cluster assembly protein [Anaerolineae bacterium]HQI87013.1 iron-sulfur cluster assembly protein [Anaerolineae bacterium]